MLGPNDHCTIPTRNETRGQDRLQTRIVLLPDWHVVTAVEQIREALAAIMLSITRHAAPGSHVTVHDPSSPTQSTTHEDPVWHVIV